MSKRRIAGRADFKGLFLKKLKVWKLKDEVTQREFSREVEAGAALFNGTWEETEDIMLKACEKTCGRTMGKRGQERETWWWNDEIERLIKEKKQTYKAWQASLLEADKRQYRIMNNRVKKEVAKAKEAAWRSWSDDLNTVEGRNKMFKLAQQMKRDKKDVLGANYIRDKDGNILVESDEVVGRWREYFDGLLNEENPSTLEEAPPVEGPMEDVTREEVKAAMRMFKAGKAAGPSEVTTEMLSMAGDTGIDMLLEVFKNIIKSDLPPEKWSKSITVPLFKGKGDALECGKYRGLRLLEHGMKIWERVLMKKLEVYVHIHDHQFGFARGKSTTDAIFLIRQLQERYLEKKLKLYHMFVDLEKAFDKVPRHVIEWALRRQLVPEWLVRAVMGLYRNSSSHVRFAGSMSEGFPVGVGVHQGSPLSPFLFKIVMEEATKLCRKGDPWELLYADDLVLTAESQQEVMEMFNLWRNAMARCGMKINIPTTKLLISAKARTAPTSGTGRWPCAICLRGVGVNSILCTRCNMWCHKRCTGLSTFSGVRNYVCLKCDGTHARTASPDESVVTSDGTIEEVNQFCYLGDVLDGSGGAERAVRSRVAAAWGKWRDLSSLLCNKSVPLKYRAQVYAACIRPTMLYAAAAWALTQRDEQMLRGCDRRMLRRICGLTLRDRVSSMEILRRCNLEDVLLTVRKRRMGWFGHVFRRESDPLARIREFEAPGRRPRGRPKKRWKDCIRDDLAAAGVQEDAAGDRAGWSAVIKRLTSS